MPEKSYLLTETEIKGMLVHFIDVANLPSDQKAKVIDAFNKTVDTKLADYDVSDLVKPEPEQPKELPVEVKKDPEPASAEEQPGDDEPEPSLGTDSAEPA